MTFTALGFFKPSWEAMSPRPDSVVREVGMISTRDRLAQDRRVGADSSLGLVKIGYGGRLSRELLVANREPKWCSVFVVPEVWVLATA